MIEKYANIRKIINQVVNGYIHQTDMVNNIFDNHLIYLELVDDILNLTNQILPHLHHTKSNINRLVIFDEIYRIQDDMIEKEDYEWAYILQGVMDNIRYNINKYDEQHRPIHK